ncbi:MAG: thioesterase family protein [Actinophytocola sp.]|nr:thioesterase family protein [Actinophytocola sp.]
MSDFDVATTVRSRADGGFDAELDGRWSAGGVPHGGYLLGVLGRAAAVVSEAAADHPHLTSVSASFLRTPVPGPARVDVDVLRIGRSTTQLRAALRQGDVLVIDALLTKGLLDDADPWWSNVSQVELPDEADCVRIPVEAPGAGFRVELMEFVDQRLDPGVLGFAMGAPSGRGVIAGYNRFVDGTDWTPLSLLIPLDAGPPASFDVGAGRLLTQQFTAYVRSLPAPGPVRFELRSRQVSGGRIDQDALVWDSKGRLVGQSTQLGAVRLPG